MVGYVECGFPFGPGGNVHQQRIPECSPGPLFYFASKVETLMTRRDHLCIAFMTVLFFREKECHQTP